MGKLVRSIDMVQVQEILDTYNYFRAHTTHVHELRDQGKKVNDVVLRTKRGEDRTPYFQGFLDFCKEQNVDPRMWMYMLFKIRGWKAAPKFTQLVPKSKKTLQKNLNTYANLSDIPLFQKMRDERNHRESVESGNDWDKNRDIGISTEAVKRRYLNDGDSERCIEEMDERTYGFHPQSLVCARCPLTTQCASIFERKFGPHIAALRRGELTVKQAKQVSSLRHGS